MPEKFISFYNFVSTFGFLGPVQLRQHLDRRPSQQQPFFSHPLRFLGRPLHALRPLQLPPPPPPEFPPPCSLKHQGTPAVRSLKQQPFRSHCRLVMPGWPQFLRLFGFTLHFPRCASVATRRTAKSKKRIIFSFNMVRIVWIN